MDDSAWEEIYFVLGITVANPIQYFGELGVRRAKVNLRLSIRTHLPKFLESNHNLIWKSGAKLIEGGFHRRRWDG